MKDPYENILLLPHHVYACRTPMPRSSRAAQFTPFAALTGYERTLREQERLTSPRKLLSEEAQEALRRTLNALADRAREHPGVRVTWFCPDARKSGGSYPTVSGVLKRIDPCAGLLILEDGRQIPLGSLTEIEEDAGIK